MHPFRMREFRAILPDPPDGYRGSQASLVLLALLTIVSTVRSLIHVFAPDGGAASIAGLDVQVEGGRNLIALFAQWGWVQLLLALTTIVILLRYRFLVPFAWTLVALEWGGRLLLLAPLKPLVVAAPPPGAVGNAVFFPLALLGLWASLPPRKGAGGDGDRPARR